MIGGDQFVTVTYESHKAQVASHHLSAEISDRAIPITSDLRFQFLETGKFSFATQPMQKADADILSIQVLVKIKQMRFDP